MSITQYWWSKISTFPKYKLLAYIFVHIAFLYIFAMTNKLKDVFIWYLHECFQKHCLWVVTCLPNSIIRPQPSLGLWEHNFAWHEIRTVRREKKHHSTCCINSIKHLMAVMYCRIIWRNITYIFILVIFYSFNFSTGMHKNLIHKPILHPTIRWTCMKQREHKSKIWSLTHNHY